LLSAAIVVAECTADPDGQFHFTGLSSGQYSVVVRSGTERYVENITVAGGPHRLDIEVPSQHPTARYMVRQSVPRNAENSVKRAVKLFNQRNYKGALKELDRAMRLAPNYADAHNEAGRCYIALGDLVKAEQSFLSAVGFTTNVYPVLNLADLYAKTSRVSEARKILEEAARKYPERGDAYYAQAAIEFREGHIESAEKLGRNAHNSIHRIADVHLLLAKILTAKGNEPAVIAELRTYVREAADTPERRRIQKLLAGITP